MYIIILIIIFVLARTTMRGLFNRAWKEKTQDIIWSIENENNFWHLMNQKINAPKVFFAYIRTRNQNDYIRVGDCVMDITLSENEVDKTDLDIKTITKTEGIRLINSVLNPKIDEKEKVITQFFVENKFNFTETEIGMRFKELEDSPWRISGDVTTHYPQFISSHLDSLINSDRTGGGIWKVLQSFAAEERKGEFSHSGEKYVDILELLKILQDDLNNFAIDLLCEKFEDKDMSEKLKKELKEWLQLGQLR